MVVILIRIYVINSLVIRDPFLLMWFYFAPSMDK